MKKLMFSFAVILAFVFIGCDDNLPTADKQQQAQQEAMSRQSNAQVGAPGIANFTEKKIVRKLYELRDQNIATYAYIPDMQGRLWHLCDSIGYGLPYGVQFTNPDKHVYDGQYNVYNIHQAEPNGLFMPPTAEGTWVICADSKGGMAPVYVEPHVIVSPFKLRAEGEYSLGGTSVSH